MTTGILCYINKLYSLLLEDHQHHCHGQEGVWRVGSSSPSLLHIYAIYILLCPPGSETHFQHPLGRSVKMIAVPHIAITTSGRCPADPGPTIAATISQCLVRWGGGRGGQEVRLWSRSTRGMDQVHIFVLSTFVRFPLSPRLSRDPWRCLPSMFGQQRFPAIIKGGYSAVMPRACFCCRLISRGETNIH